MQYCVHWQCLKKKGIIITELSTKSNPMKTSLIFEDFFFGIGSGERLKRSRGQVLTQLK